MPDVNQLASRRILLASVVSAVLALGGCAAGDAGPTGLPSSDRGSSPGPTMTDAATSRPSSTSPGHCDGTIGQRAVDDVVVPRGATCRLVGTRVDGNVSVGRSGVLFARQVDVDGDVESEGARGVRVVDSLVGGNVQLEQGGSALVQRSAIQGDLLFEEQAGRSTARRNVVRGNLQADGNRGPLSITRNRIGGDLECEENARVLAGSRNVVSGSREGTCERG